MEQWLPENCVKIGNVDVIPARYTQLETAEIESLRYHCSICLFGEKPTGLTHSPEAMKSLADRIDTTIADMGLMEAFMRLSRRSPKDSWNGLKHQFRVRTGRDAISFLVDSERIFEDLALCDHQGLPVVLAVRPFVEIPFWTEYRCFVKDGELRGITQYFCRKDDVFPEIDEMAAVIERKLKQAVPAVADACHFKDCTIDFFFDDGTPTLIEINPFPITPGLVYPGLFEDGHSFDTYEFRYSK